MSDERVMDRSRVYIFGVLQATTYNPAQMDDARPMAILREHTGRQFLYVHLESCCVYPSSTCSAQFYRNTALLSTTIRKEWCHLFPMHVIRTSEQITYPSLNTDIPTCRKASAWRLFFKKIQDLIPQAQREPY